MPDEVERLQAELVQCQKERRSAYRVLGNAEKRLRGAQRACKDQVDVINQLLLANDRLERLVNPYYSKREPLPRPAANPYARGH